MGVSKNRATSGANNGSLSFISIQNMLSGVKDYDGKNYFSLKQSADSDGSVSVSMFSAKEQSRWQEYGKTFRENIEQALAGEVPRNKVLKICDTPLILQELGIPNLPILQNEENSKKIKKTYQYIRRKLPIMITAFRP